MARGGKMVIVGTFWIIPTLVIIVSSFALGGFIYKQNRNPIAVRGILAYN